MLDPVTGPSSPCQAYLIVERRTWFRKVEVIHKGPCDRMIGFFDALELCGMKGQVKHMEVTSLDTQGLKTFKSHENLSFKDGRSFLYLYNGLSQAKTIQNSQ